MGTDRYAYQSRLRRISPMPKLLLTGSALVLCLLCDSVTVGLVTLLAMWGLVTALGGLSPRVFLLKLTPGLSPDLIPDIFRLYDCVIVESFGVGGIPQRLMDAFAEGLGDYDKTHKVLILTTQVTYEGSDVGIYEVGKRVKNRFRFLEAHDMTIEAVVTKIMWLLAQDCDSFDQLQQRFYRQVNFDTFYH